MRGKIAVLCCLLAYPFLSATAQEDSVHWKSLFGESLFFLGVEHSFRVATDPGVREGLKGSFAGGYADSVANVHGWGDGDPFVVNYVGHPIQGAVAGNIWIHNDSHYRRTEIGRNRAYWASRARATAFAWAYSEQFELGPFSEASIGHIQRVAPQQGLIDHVITPVLGGGWMIAEDALDRFVVKRIERHTNSATVKILARTLLNPSRTFANCMELQLPWNRETRSGIFGPEDRGDQYTTRPAQLSMTPKVSSGGEARIPSFEFAATSGQMLLGAGGRHVACAGGGGTATFNLNTVLSIDADVSGCKMIGLAHSGSGDALIFSAGPRFSYRNATRWTPWVNSLAGGEKLTRQASSTAGNSSVGFRMSVGGGVDWDLNPTVGFRVGNLEYSRVFMKSLNGDSYPDDLRLTMGVVLRFNGE